jgi:ribA/ribD-fused uncharacterized protein
MARSDFTYFWQAKSPFSQWYPCNFTIKGITFNCAEQAIMYKKAILFGDEEIAKKILAVTPESVKGTDKCFQKVQKELGRQVRNYNEELWQKNREELDYEVNYCKFTQNQLLLNALLKTAGTILVEASRYDTIWGIGLEEIDPLAEDQSTWKGLNLLGKTLTLVRDNIMDNK